MVESIFSDFVIEPTCVILWSVSYVLLMVGFNDSECYNDVFYALHMYVCVHIKTHKGHGL